MKSPFILTASLAAISLFSVTSAHAQTLVDWTFETSAPATAGPFMAEAGLEANLSTAVASGFHTSASAVYSAPAGNGSAKSFSSNFWSLGDYYQFTLSTTSFSDLVVAFDQTSSSTGPANYKLSYSIDGTNFTDFTTYSPIVNSSPNAWSASTPAPAAHLSFDLSSVSAIDNVSQVTFRLVTTSTTAENGSAVGTAGTDRVDNFTVTSVPEPSAMLSLITAVGVMALRRRRSFGV